MPVYVLNPLLSEMRQNPLAYDLTPVIMVGKPQYRLVRGKAGHKQRSKQKYLPSSETHALNPKTGAAFCGAGLRGPKDAKVLVPELIHRVDRPVVTCMRCIKVITLNNIDRSVPGIERVLGTIERELKPSSEKKREKHVMIRGGDQGRYVSGSEAYISSRKPFRDHRERTRATGGPLYRGTEGITDFNKYVGWMGRPTQTIGEKRGRILSERVSAAEERRRAAAAAAYAESGMGSRIAEMEDYSAGAADQFEVLSAARGRAAAVAKRREQTAARRAREEAARADRAAALAGSGRGFAGEEYMDNPRRRGGRAAQKRGLAKGQCLMQKAAAAYRAGKYPTMQSALRGVARTSNPLSEDGMVVNPRRKSRKGSKSSGRTAAQSDAARAMSLYRSGRADTLAEAWSMVKRGR
jgi:hypothetical protein